MDNIFDNDRMARGKINDAAFSLADAIAHRLMVCRCYAKVSLLILLLALPAAAFAQPNLSTRVYYGGFTHTLYPELGPIPGFSRTNGSSNGKVKDAFGAWQDVLPGEARFVGANRVANLIPDSEAFGTSVWWTDPNASSYVTKGNALAVPNPLTPGRNTIIPFSRTQASSLPLLVLKSRTYQVIPHVFSIAIDGDNTTGNVKVGFVRSSDGTVASSYIVTPKPGANRYCFPMSPIDTTNHKVEIALTNNGVQQLAVGTAQMETAYLQTGTCNNYVPKGVPGGSYPYQGAGVDGVQYFDTINQWAYVPTLIGGENRVANLIPDSESFGTVQWWTDPNASSYVTMGNALATPNPLTPGRNTIIPFTRTSAFSGPLLIYRSRSYKVMPYVFSIVIDGDNTSGNVKVSFVRTSDQKAASNYIVTPRPGANRYCFPMTPMDTTNHRIELALTNNGVQQLAVGTAQLEDVSSKPALCNNYVPSAYAVQTFNTFNQWAYESGNYGLVTPQIPTLGLLVPSNYGLVNQQTPTKIDPAALKGILIEPYTINKMLYNNTFSNAIWIKTGITIAEANKIDTPFGPKTLTKLAEDGNVGNHGVSQFFCKTCSGVYSSSTSSTVSAVVSPAERTWAYLEINSGSSVVGYAYFNLLTGTVGTFSGQNAYADIWAEGKSWRISLTVDAGDSWASYPGSASAKLYAATANGVIDYQGVAGYGIYAGLTQWEINEMATSYNGQQTAATIRYDDYMAIDLPSILPSISSFAVSLGITPWFYTASPAKSNWYCILCATYNNENRFGFGLRPGSKQGGFYEVQLINTWYIDYYPNSSLWNGAHLTYIMKYGNSTRGVFTFGPNDLSTFPSWGVSGSAMMVGGIYGETQTSELLGSPTLNYSAIMPQSLFLGRFSGDALLVNNKSFPRLLHPMSYKDISVIPYQLTKDEILMESVSPQ